MSNPSAERYAFIGHALRGDGPFRPRVVETSTDTQATLSGPSALVRYPRESPLKYARRNQVAHYASPLMRATSRFVGYLSSKPPARELGHDVYDLMSEDIDAKGSGINVFMGQFSVNAKARGAMLLQVDMPTELGANAAEQLASRRVPYWIPIAPEAVTEYAIGDDGKFDFVEYTGRVEKSPGEYVDCVWHFDRTEWWAKEADGAAKDAAPIKAGEHPLKECPVLIFTEADDFPSFGPFSAIADVAKRLFNAESELDEILRGATFPLLHQQAPEGSTAAQKVEAAKATGETIGVNNMIVWSGTSPPGFIAPPDGPAKVYMDRIAKLEQRIDEIGLNVAAVNQQESGLAMRMRFAAINAELSSFAERMEDLERRAWELSRRWLGFQAAPVVRWHRDFNLADVGEELRILQDMQAAAMPAEVIAEQQRRIVSVQFAGLDAEAMDAITKAIDERSMEPRNPKEPQGVTT